MFSYNFLTAADADRRDGSRDPQGQQTTTESSYSTDSYSARAGHLSTGYASNISNNSTPLKSIPVKATEPSNGCMQGDIIQFNSYLKFYCY